MVTSGKLTSLRFAISIPQFVADGLQRLYAHFGLSGMEAVATFGPTDACVKGVRAVAEAGAELIQFTPVSDEAEQMERLAAEVMPRLS
jgi:hypothetical protein